MDSKILIIIIVLVSCSGSADKHRSYSELESDKFELLYDSLYAPNNESDRLWRSGVKYIGFEFDQAYSSADSIKKFDDYICSNLWQFDSPGRYIDLQIKFVALDNSIEALQYYEQVVNYKVFYRNHVFYGKKLLSMSSFDTVNPPCIEYIKQTE